MRYKFNEVAPSGKRQYSLLVGSKDIEILLGLTNKLCENMPSLDKKTNADYEEIYGRIRSMNKALLKANREALKLGDNGKTVHSQGNINV
jgi:hypothetical protein